MALFQSDLAGVVSREQYAAHIPKACSMKTIEVHEQAMLCWGLLRSIENGVGTYQGCQHCDENQTNYDAREIRLALRKKEKK